jgi:hypothetical protein
MKYIAKIVGGSLLLTAISAHAGFNGNTAHSRANCAGFEVLEIG